MVFFNFNLLGVFFWIDSAICVLFIRIIRCCRWVWCYLTVIRCRSCARRYYFRLSSLIFRLIAVLCVGLYVDSLSYSEDVAIKTVVICCCRFSKCHDSYFGLSRDVIISRLPSTWYPSITVFTIILTNQLLDILPWCSFQQILVHVFWDLAIHLPARWWYIIKIFIGNIQNHWNKRRRNIRLHWVMNKQNIVFVPNHTLFFGVQKSKTFNVTHSDQMSLSVNTCSLHKLTTQWYMKLISYYLCAIKKKQE